MHRLSMHRLSMYRLLAACALLAATPAAGATLRPMTVLHAPVVRLSDLFDDAGPLGARVLGTSPAPGERIVVPASQLAAIARMFGVDWRPASPADTAILERPGKLLPRGLVLAALRSALADEGAPPDAELNVPDFEAPLVPAEAGPQATVAQLDYSAATGRFTAELAVAAPQMPPLQLRVSGSVEPMVEVLVPAGRLAAGTVLRAGDLQPARVRAALLRGEVVRDEADAVGMVLRHAAFPGQPVAKADLIRPGLIARGASVVMQIEAAGLVATARGVALGGGGPGETITVLNPVSHLAVQGQILPSGIVAVSPGTVPAPAAGANQLALR
jgi:flagella basal body P-ring formation protein FlgA